MTSSESGLRGAIDPFMRQYGAPRETQQVLLRQILRRNAGTVFGRDHGFGKIETARDYQRQVPIRQWVDMSPYVDSVIDGQPAVLTKEPPYFFQRTTGTTGTPKMIPMTRRCLAAVKLTHRMWIYRALLDNPGMLRGRVMGILNAGIDGYTAHRQAYGSVSGNIYFRMPAIVRRAYSHPYDVYHIENVEARRYALLRFAVGESCSFVFTGNPSSLLAVFSLADHYSETLIKDIHDGTLAASFEIPDPIRVRALNDLRPNPRRARALATARARAGRLKPVDYWPALSVLACWIGGSMGHFSPLLRDWCGEGFRFRDAGYMASEGVFSIPLANDSPDGLLSLHAVFFEFVPEHDFGRPDAAALLAHELEPERNYHVVITTPGGLYRYAINDVIRVTGRHQASPLLRFLYKGGNVQNLQGEMVTVDHVMSAVAALAAEFGVKLQHFQVVAELAERRYVLHIEPTQCPPRPVLERMLASFDRELGKVNENYAMFRADRLIGEPMLQVMQKGWFDRISQDHLLRSGRDSQYKPAVLVSAAEQPEMAEFSLALPGAETPAERRIAG
jgi:hypothetical protein